MLEKELKAMLTEKNFYKIEKMYPWNSIKKKENHYYTDTNGILSQNKSVFRIRYKDEKYTVQVKLHKNTDGALHVCEEKEFPIDTAPESISPECGIKYTGLNTGRLLKLGFNTTLRHSFMWNDTTEICLDKTTYFDETDYEIEIEYRNECPQELLDELKNVGVEFETKSIGKYSRFIKKWNDIVTQII